jgi:uncharacterized pyridoxamine 5'-phosphate oxidase family protein
MHDAKRVQFFVSDSVKAAFQRLKEMRLKSLWAFQPHFYFVRIAGEGESQRAVWDRALLAQLSLP